MRNVLDGYAPKDLIEVIGDEVPISALFTTFTFSPATFQEQYLRPLQRCGCERVVVLVDSLGYAQSVNEAAFAQGVGTDYVLRRVPCGGAFHAKMVIIQTPSRTLVAVGSGNLTVSGIIANAEVGAICAVQDREAQEQLDLIALRLRSLGGLCAAPTQPVGPVLIAEDTWLLTSLHRPLVEQIKVEEPVQRIEITSPFLDPTGGVLRWFRSKWPGIPIRIRVDPHFGSLPATFVSQTSDDLTVQVPQTNDGANRPVHGKLFMWMGDQHTHIMLGSANCTSAALQQRANIEAVLFRRLPTKEAKQLLTVPDVHWRTARTSDAVKGSQLNGQNAMEVLLAELHFRQLRLTWPGRVAVSGTLEVLNRGRCYARQTVTGVAQQGGVLMGTITLPADAVRLMDGARLGRLTTEDGKIYVGWIEVKELLDTPPDAKRRLNFLNDLADDPENCEEDGLVRFLEWLRRGLDAQRILSPRHLGSPPGHLPADSEDDESVERRSLLENYTAPSALGDNAWENFVEGSFDSATTHIRFFEQELGHAGGSGRSIHGGTTEKHQVGKRTNRPAVPPNILTVLQNLFNQLKSSLSTCRTAEDVASRLRQLPMCIKALRYCSARWRVSASDSRHFVCPAVIALLGPGLASAFMIEGAMTMLTKDERCALMKYHGVPRAIAYLEALLLTLTHTNDFGRKELVRDMLDVIRPMPKALTVDETETIRAEVWETIGRRIGEAPDYDDIEADLMGHEGEIGRLRRQRQALRQLIALVRSGKATRDMICEASKQVTSSDKGATALIDMLCPFLTSPSRLQLAEVRSDETACPRCYMAIAGGDLARMNDAAFIFQHRCGTLLVRHFE